MTAFSKVRRTSSGSSRGRPKKAPGSAKSSYFNWSKYPNLVTQLKAYMAQDFTAEEIASKPTFADTGITAKQISNKVNSLKIAKEGSSRCTKFLAGELKRTV